MIKEAKYILPVGPSWFVEWESTKIDRKQEDNQSSERNYAVRRKLHILLEVQVK